MAIENMNGQFLGGKQITVQYAFKKDSKGERHGTQAERILAAQAKYVFSSFRRGLS
jgi:splicing factor 3B subunit 4